MNHTRKKITRSVWGFCIITQLSHLSCNMASNGVVQIETTGDDFTDDEDGIDPKIQSLLDILDDESGHIIVNGNLESPVSEILIPDDYTPDLLKTVDQINFTVKCFDDNGKSNIATVDGELSCKAQDTFNALSPENMKEIYRLYNEQSNSEDNQDALVVKDKGMIGKHRRFSIYCYSQDALYRMWLMLRNVRNARIAEMRRESKTVWCVFMNVRHLKPSQTRHFFGVKGHRIESLTKNFGVFRGLLVQDIPESLLGSQEVLIAKTAAAKLTRDGRLEEFRAAVNAAIDNAFRIQDSEDSKEYEEF